MLVNFKISSCLISSLAINAKSWAVVKCPSSSSPWGFLNVVLTAPNSFALLFIILTKLLSVPPIFSATATLASLALPIAIDLSNISTVAVLFSSKYTWLPPILEALALIFTSSSKEILPLSIASTVKSIVIILVIDAGDFCSSIFLSNKIFPVLASIIIPLSLFISIPLKLSAFKTSKLNIVNKTINNIFLIYTP